MITMGDEPAAAGKTRESGVRFQERMQRVEKALAALGNISGEYPAGVLQEAAKVLHGRVDQAIARIHTEQQLTLYSQLEAQAESTCMTATLETPDERPTS